MEPFVVSEDVQLVSFEDDAMDVDALRQTEDELSSDTIARLLREAEQRLQAKNSSLEKADNLSSISLRFPKLDPGALPKPPIAAQGKDRVQRVAAGITVNPEDKKLAEEEPSVPLPAKARKLKLKEEKEKTAGGNWFDMPRTVLTTETKRDMDLIKLRSVLDPKRFYKKEKRKSYPTYSQMGTVVEGNTEFFSARLTRKERKKTILDEVMADDVARSKFKKKMLEVDAKTRSGRKAFYKNLQEGRKKR